MVRRTDKVRVEVVYTENFLEPLRLEEVADAPRLPGVIHRARDRIGPRVEAVIVQRFVHSYAPQNYRGVVPVPLDHRLHVPAGELFPFLVANVLPSRHLLEKEEADLVATVEEVYRLRVVGGAHDVALELSLEDIGVPTLHTRGHRSPHIRVGLVSVQTSQLKAPSIQEEPLRGEPCLPEPYARSVLVGGLSVLIKPHEHRVQLRIPRVPQFDRTNVGQGEAEDSIIVPYGHIVAVGSQYPRPVT